MCIERCAYIQNNPNLLGAELPTILGIPTKGLSCAKCPAASTKARRTKPAGRPNER